VRTGSTNSQHYQLWDVNNIMSMTKIYTYCSDERAFQNNKILSAPYCMQFPGISWILYFIDFAKDKGHVVMTGDECVKAINNKEIKASDVTVISDIDSQHAKSLVSMGCKPGIVLCSESPLFAETFYEEAASICADYKAGILFNGIIERNFSGRHNYHPMHYPSYSNDEINTFVVPWEKRKEMVVVLSNKYYRDAFHFKSLFNPKKFEAWIRGKLKLSSKSIKRLATKNQLHDTRLSAIDYFCNQSFLDIYGYYWNDLNNLPLKWRKRLKHHILKRSPGQCEDKKQTIANYKYALCFENTIYPGYLTEKIIDCFVAGVIPIYLGDPVVEKTIPPDIFIDMRKYNNWDDLYLKIKSMSKIEGESMIRKARQFLESESGQSFTYYNHAKKIFDLISQQ
jgi:Glycosyltransferase family 10 (fucosyltransferase) C-term